MEDVDLAELTVEEIVERIAALMDRLTAPLLEPAEPAPQ